MLTRTALVSCVIVLCLVAAGGCASSAKNGVQETQRFGPDQVALETINALLLAFADEHATAVLETVNRGVEQTDDLGERGRLIRASLGNAYATFFNASETNPVAGVIDMVVLMSLMQESIRRTAIDRTLTEEERFDPTSYALSDGQVDALLTPTERALLRTFEESDQEIMELAERILWPEQIAELQAMITEWWEKYPARRNVTLVRFDDFAEMRAASVQMRAGGPRNLFALFFLDPLASMDPTVRQIAQSRMLAERYAFLLGRMPFLITQHTRGMLYETLTAEEIVAVRESLTGAEATLARAVDILDRLPEDIEAQRELAIDHAAEVIDEQRIAAIEQIEEAVERRIEATIASIEARGESLRGTLTELDAALASANELSGSARETARAIEAMDLSNYQRLAESTSKTAGSVERSLDALERLAAQRDPSNPLDLRDSAADAKEGMGSLIDHLYRRGTQLVLMLVGGALVVVVAAKVIPSRDRQAGRAARPLRGES